MRTGTSLFAGIFAASALFVTSAVAQHEEHQAKPGAPESQMTGMASPMPAMMAAQSQTAKLAEELNKSFAAIEAEKKPAARKAKMAAHAALLKELQTSVEAQNHSMGMMHQMMMGGEKMDHSKMDMSKPGCCDKK